MRGPGPRRRPRLAQAVALSLLALVSWALMLPGAAQETESDQLEALERAVQEDRGKAAALQRKAETLAAELRELRRESIAAARQAQDYEARLSRVEARLAELEREQAAKLADLKRRRRQLTGTLAALQRIAILPADALIVAPGSPLRTVRSAMLLRVAVPAIEERAAVLRDELGELTRLRQQIALEREDLGRTQAALEAEQARLSALIRRKGAARAAVSAEQEAAEERARHLAQEARDLRDLLARLKREARERAARRAKERAEREARELAEKRAREEAEMRARELAGGEPEAAPDKEATRLALARPDNIRPFPESRASLRMPARGRVVLRYGQSRSDEAASKGISIRARGGAQVVAPYDGKVVYAGPFRHYGQILIIEHGGRYHTLLAGLDRLDVVMGQWLLAGEPVGVLDSPQSGQVELYVELRRAGQPINPLPWLATTGDKVRG